MYAFPLYDFRANWSIAFCVLLIRYFIIAGGAFFLTVKLFKNKWAHKKIQQRAPKSSIIEMEISSSILSFVIFAAMMALVIILRQMGYTKIYVDAGARGYWYLPVSFLMLLFIHDTYFYWVHRGLHLPVLYKTIHVHHHRSKSPTPWAAFSFHPLEAVVEFIFMIPLVLVVPVHIVVLMIFAVAMTAMNVMGHLGYELFPAGFLRRPAGKLFNTTTHHDMHHHYTRYNFGLYFNIWDRLMKTNHPKYGEQFEKTASASPPGPVSPSDIVVDPAE